MLVLSRKVNESLVIDSKITIRVLAINGSRLKIGIEAPGDVGIQREEMIIESAASGRLMPTDQAQPDSKQSGLQPTGS